MSTRVCTPCDVCRCHLVAERCACAACGGHGKSEPSALYVTQHAAGETATFQANVERDAEGRVFRYGDG